MSRLRFEGAPGSSHNYPHGAIPVGGHTLTLAQCNALYVVALTEIEPLWTVSAARATTDLCERPIRRLFALGINGVAARTLEERGLIHGNIFGGRGCWGVRYTLTEAGRVALNGRWQAIRASAKAIREARIERNKQYREIGGAS